MSTVKTDGDLQRNTVDLPNSRSDTAARNDQGRSINGQRTADGETTNNKELPATDNKEKQRQSVERANNNTEPLQQQSNERQCACSNIAIMQLFHELKAKFPAVPDHVVSQCISDQQHDRDACIKRLGAEQARQPRGLPYPPGLMGAYYRNHNNAVVTSSSTACQQCQCGKLASTEKRRNSFEPSQQNDNNKLVLPPLRKIVRGGNDNNGSVKNEFLDGYTGLKKRSQSVPLSSDDLNNVSLKCLDRCNTVESKKAPYETVSLKSVLDSGDKGESDKGVDDKNRSSAQKQLPPTNYELKTGKLNKCAGEKLSFFDKLKNNFKSNREKSTFYVSRDVNDNEKGAVSAAGKSAFNQNEKFVKISGVSKGNDMVEIEESNSSSEESDDGDEEESDNSVSDRCEGGGAGGDVEGRINAGHGKTDEESLNSSADDADNDSNGSDDDDDGNCDSDDSDSGSVLKTTSFTARVHKTSESNVCVDVKSGSVGYLNVTNDSQKFVYERSDSKNMDSGFVGDISFTTSDNCKAKQSPNKLWKNKSCSVESILSSDTYNERDVKLKTGQFEFNRRGSDIIPETGFRSENVTTKVSRPDYLDLNKSFSLSKSSRIKRFGSSSDENIQKSINQPKNHSKNISNISNTNNKGMDRSPGSGYDNSNFLLEGQLKSPHTDQKPPLPKRPNHLDIIKGHSSPSSVANSPAGLNVSLNVNVDVLTSPTKSKKTSVLNVNPEPTWASNEDHQSPRSFTSVNLTLRTPTSEPQPPIDISSANSSLTYSTSSYDPKKGFQSQLKITVGPAGGSVSALRTKSRWSHVPDQQRSPVHLAPKAESLPDLKNTRDEVSLRLLRQIERKERLRIALVAERNKLVAMQEEVKQLEAAPAVAAALEARLRIEIRDLQDKCRALTEEIDKRSGSRVPLGETNEEFYRNIYTGQRGDLRCVSRSTTTGSNTNLYQGNAGDGSNQQEGGPSWTCHVCTFSNHPLMNKCEECGMPRIVLVNASPGDNIHIHVTPGPSRRVVHSWVV